MKAAPKTEHAELLILPDGQILAHNITPAIAAVLAELDPKNELIRQRVVKTSSPLPTAK